MHAIIRFAASTCLQIVFAILACNSKVVAQLENPAPAENQAPTENQTPTETITPFDVKVDQRLEKLGAFRITREIDRSELVSRYRSLLDDASTATQRSKIMLELAVVYEIRAKKGKYTWDMDKAIKWYRKSYEVTPSTSRQRVVAANRLAQRLQRRRKPGDIAFSREILDAVVDEFDQLSLNGKLELNLLTQELAERKYLAADRRCRRVLGNPEFDVSFKVIMANRLLTAWPNSSDSFEERKKWITEFSTTYAGIPLVSETSQRSLRQLAGREENSRENSRLTMFTLLKLFGIPKVEFGGFTYSVKDSAELVGAKMEGYENINILSEGDLFPEDLLDYLISGSRLELYARALNKTHYEECEYNYESREFETTFSYDFESSVPVDWFVNDMYVGTGEMISYTVPEPPSATVEMPLNFKVHFVSL